MSLKVTGSGFGRMGAATLAWGEAVPASVQREAEEEAQRVLEIAQGTVHVETGALRDSGRIESVDLGGNEIEVDVVFGGGEVEYADQEEMLHPYLMPAVEQGDFEGALGRGLDGGD